MAASLACVAGGGSNLATQTVAGSDLGPSTQLAAQALVPNHIPPVNPCTSGQPAPRALRRLTADEYNASTRDLLGGDASVPQSGSIFDADPSAYGFDNIQSNLVVTRNTIGDVVSQAEAVGAWAAAHPTAVAAGCADASDTCTRQWIADVGRRAFRRPLAAGEIDDYTGLVADIGDQPTRMEVAVAAMLQSPHFLYRSEVGVAAGGAFALTPHEVATELSYLVTGSIPDAALMAAADGGQLATPAQVLAQGRRLLADPRARRHVVSFFLAWLQVADLPGQVHAESDGTTLSTAQKVAMQQEVAAFVGDLVFDSNGALSDLLSAKHTFLDATLSALYGVDGGGGETFSRVDWANGERLGGVLGQGGVLAAASQATFASPTLRGRALRMRMLCQSIPAPPANVSQLDMSASFKTLREQFAAHDQNPVCASCHGLMDPLAFPLGNFDAVGRRRPQDMENGVVVDLNGMVNAPTVGAPTPLADGAALTAYLAASPQVADCASRHMAIWGLGQLSFAQDGCTYDAAAAFVRGQSAPTLATVFLALTQTPSFLTRSQDP